MPLSVFRGEQPAPGTWSRKDAILAQALRLYELDVHKCGQPLIYSTNPSARKRYVVKTQTCHACAELDAADAADDSSNKASRFGRVRFVVPDEALRYGYEHPNEHQGGVLKEADE